MSTLAPSSPQPSAIRLAHLILIIVAGGLMDHAKEAGVVDVELVACAELVPPVLERRAHFVVHVASIQGHELGLPSHL